jgi:putative oxygen-independent coproporphyrinogen III oxidase
MHTIPLSLYIHFPWCLKKCPYCDFNSYASPGTLDEAAYVNALITDLENDLPLISERKIETIYCGGGTPSLFSTKALENFFQQIQKKLSFDQQIEISLEVNPGTMDLHKATQLKNTPVNRLSIGVQSFQNDKLQALGRIHDAKAALDAVHAVQKAGFNNINLDVIYGLPNQTLADALFDLQTAIDLKPTHISWYQLTIESGSVFHLNPPTLPTEDLIWDMQEAGQALLAKNGFAQYEISAYANNNQKCRHNLNYWSFGDYLGIGAGAHGKITDYKTGLIRRLEKKKKPKEYLANQKFISAQRLLSLKEIPFEFMLNALRLTQPFSMKIFSERTGLSIDFVKPILIQAEMDGFVKISEDFWQTTKLGQNFLNDLLQRFM